MTDEARAAFYKANAESEAEENSNLRKLLLWAVCEAGKKMSPFEFGQMGREMMRRMSARETLVVPDWMEERREEDLEWRRHVGALCDMADKVVDTPDPRPYLDQMGLRLSEHARALRSMLGPEPEHTVHSYVRKIAEEKSS